MDLNSFNLICLILMALNGSIVKSETTTPVTPTDIVTATSTPVTLRDEVTATTDSLVSTTTPVTLQDDVTATTDSLVPSTVYSTLTDKNGSSPASRSGLPLDSNPTKVKDEKFGTGKANNSKSFDFIPKKEESSPVKKDKEAKESASSTGKTIAILISSLIIAVGFIWATTLVYRRYKAKTYDVRQNIEMGQQA